MSINPPPLSKLDFEDLYVRLDQSAPSRYSPRPDPNGRPLPGNLPVPPEFEVSAGLLVNQINSQHRDEFSIDLGDMRLRGARRTMVLDEVWCSLRRIPPEPPRLDALNFKPEILKIFRSWGGRYGGLILIGGATAAGKTTTAVALLRDYLERRGRLAYTIEDPVEFMMQGPVGQGGYCFQVEVQKEEEWGEAVMTAFRFRPRYIFVGEIRTAAAARHLLRAAVSGHLVMCTIHGGTIEETLSSLLQTAQSELGDTAAPLLADGLCAVVHQRLVRGVPEVSLLQTDGDASNEKAIRSTIRQRQLERLGTYIQQQEAIRTTTALPARSVVSPPTRTVGGAKPVEGPPNPAAKWSLFGNR